MQCCRQRVPCNRCIWCHGNGTITSQARDGAERLSNASTSLISQWPEQLKFILDSTRNDNLGQSQAFRFSAQMSFRTLSEFKLCICFLRVVSVNRGTPLLTDTTPFFFNLCDTMVYYWVIWVFYFLLLVVLHIYILSGINILVLCYA